MFWDDILLVTEQAERYGLRSPMVDLCGEVSPCIADYDLTTKTGDQLARFVSLNDRPFAHIDPTYVTFEGAPSIELFQSLSQKFSQGIGFGILLEVLERCEDPQETLNQIFKALQQNSILIVSACFSYPYQPQPNDYWRFSPEGLKRLAERAGFSVLECGWRLQVTADAGVKELKNGFSQEVRTAYAALSKGNFIPAPGPRFALPARRSSNAKAMELLREEQKLISEKSASTPPSQLAALAIGALGKSIVAEPPLLRGRHCVLLNTFYGGFLTSIYSQVQNLSQRPYNDQLRVLQESCFGDSDFYSAGLKKAGWQATDLIINASTLQQQWAREHSITGNDLQIALKQIRDLRPDVLYCQDMHFMSRQFLEEVRPHTKLIVGQIASPYSDLPLDLYDLVITSFPHFAERFKQKGVYAMYQPLAFEPRVLQRLAPVPSFIDRRVLASFIGGISSNHSKRTDLLERLANKLPIEFWGYGKESLLSDSPIARRHHGEVWGRDMFRKLGETRITFNVHIDAAEHNANNMRLFEATGMGTLLITDYKDNLSELFEIGDEIIAYRHPDECVALAEYYLENPREAEAIAAAGQTRTLRDHTYTARLEQTANILDELLRRHA